MNKHRFFKWYNNLILLIMTELFPNLLIVNNRISIHCRHPATSQRITEGNLYWNCIVQNPYHKIKCSFLLNNSNRHHNIYWIF